MDIQQERRGRLRAYIARNFPRDGDPKGNVSAFAQAIGMQQSQIADMLDRRKSFGEKVARRLEAEASRKHLPPMSLDGGSYEHAQEPEAVMRTLDRVADSSTRLYGHDVTEEAVMFAKEWEKLPASLRAQVQALVHMMVAELVRTERGRPPEKTTGTKPTGPRPHRTHA